MSQFTLTIEDLEKQTALTRKYIDRCHARFGSLLAAYRMQSPEQNKYLYSNDALVVFQQVRHFKDLGMKLPEIRDRLIEELGSRAPGVESGEEVEERTMESSSSSHAPDETKMFIAAIKDAYEMAMTSEKGRVLLLEETLEMRKKREGEFVRKIASFHANSKRRGELLSELEDLAGKLFSGKKRLSIIQEIRHIDSIVQNELGRAIITGDNKYPEGEH